MSELASESCSQRRAGLVGLVVVSHSQALADAALELARQMLHGADGPDVVAAAGLDDGTLGTDATRIAGAITKADRGAGVVVLMDMGSAVLSAQVALELIDPALAEQVVLCSAPLVEGLVVAAVTAAGGAATAVVAAEAEAALGAKRAAVGGPVASATPVEAPAQPARTAVVRVSNEHGLHARPAARLVQTVHRLDADVRLRNRTTGSDWVSGGSLSAVATLGVLHDHELEIEARGDRADQALAEVTALADRAFDEQGGRPVGTRAATTGPLPASPGIAVGPARVWRTGSLDVATAMADDPAAERARLAAALSDTRSALHALRERAQRELGTAEADVFEAHLLLLDDPDLVAHTHARLADGLAAESAWAESVRALRDRFAALPDPYQRARAADVTDVGSQVLQALGGERSAHLDADGVVVTGELTPAAAAELDPARVAAVVQAYSSPTAHSAILLRARGIPAVAGAGPEVLDLADGTPIAVDGTRGVVVVDPTPDVADEYRQRAAALAQRRRAALRTGAAPAHTKDGVAVSVGANVDSVAAATAAAANGADLAGLVRTEFLFLDRTAPPDVDEQHAAYRALADAMNGARITLRTLDVGGDKPLRYLPMPAEANPFLGVRGIRLSMARPDVFADQLRAVVRTAHETPVSVMFPMVTTVDELRWARERLDEAVRAEGRGAPAGLETGVMIEVPSAALKARALAPYVDFFSIGTNDLVQYAMAAERGSAAVAALADPYDPGVAQLVAHVCRAGKPVSVCGEVAADEGAAALLVGLGVRRLSVAAPAVPTVKQAVREIDSVAAARLAEAACAAASGAEVRALLGSS
ncbi:phosphoenolpyruvate--protein phosphotransferase [Pseudonocardia sp. CA-107938]|uniref:phosphoenolpyruvate--protein phosphotransferase n=1 Tax=Pseudonocardia sp. CA-107938 TaxID=3240021 RepID=UPI003D92B9D0